MLLTLLIAAAVPQGCAAPRSQTAMIMCANAAYERADAGMTRQWRSTQAHMRALDARDTSRGGGFGYAAALLESQRAWLRYRDAQCMIEAGRYAGGSLQPMVRAQCGTRLTNARTQQLRGLVWPR